MSFLDFLIFILFFQLPSLFSSQISLFKLFLIQSIDPYAKLYPPSPMLSFSYRKICAVFESSKGAERATATRAANAMMNFMMIIFKFAWSCVYLAESFKLY
jgi:hypothetical protein